MLKIIFLTVAVTFQQFTAETQFEISKPQITQSPSHKVSYSEEKVTLKCEVHNAPSDLQYKWFKGSARLSSNADASTITVHNSGKYACKAIKGASESEKSDYHTLDLKVIPTAKLTMEPMWAEFYTSEKVTLNCEIEDSLDDWSYKWYKNRGIAQYYPSALKFESVKNYDSGDYTCQGFLKDRVFTAISTSVTLKVNDHWPKLHLSHNPDFKVMYSGEKLMLNCEVEVPLSEYLFFKDSTQINADTSKNRFSITSAQVSDSGIYSCQVRRKGVMSDMSDSITITVKELPEAQVESVWKEAFLGETVSLQCVIQGESENWIYTWFRDENIVHNGPDTKITGNTLSILVKHSLTVTNWYSCQAKLEGRPGETSKSTLHVLKVYGSPPTILLKQVPDYPEIYTGEQVKLTCGIQEQTSQWEYQWIKDHKISDDQTFTIPSAALSHSGLYTCQISRKGVKFLSEPKSLTISKLPQPKLSMQVSWREFYPTEKVTLKCSVNENSNDWNYEWFRNEIKLPITEDILSINSVKPSDSGRYKCSGKHLKRSTVTTSKTEALQIHVFDVTPKLKIRKHPSFEFFFTDEQVRLMDCNMPGVGWEYRWFKDSKPTQPSTADTNYFIKSASLSDTGEYHCEAKRGDFSVQSETLNVQVQEIPQPKLSIESKWKEFYPTENVILKCSINEKDWGIEWYRNGTKPSIGENVSFFRNMLKINSAKTNHSGSYMCRGKHLKRSTVMTSKTEALQLHVFDVTPELKVTKHPSFEFYYTDEQVQLNCNMPGVGWEYHWYKDSKPTQPSTADTNYINKSASLSDTGEYHCKAKRGNFSVQSETQKVQVNACPHAVLSLVTDLGDIIAGNVNILTLRCDVTDENKWNYTWYKNDDKQNESSDIFKVGATDEIIKSEYKCKGVRTERPLSSSVSEGFIPNNIVFKRKILLGISGCLVCCIVILIAGCIVLKTTRKPEKKQTVCEDLFISVADYKNQASLPLVTYMANKPTDKESGEKEDLILDRISVTHVDGVIKGEDTPSAASNGLTSFKGT